MKLARLALVALLIAVLAAGSLAAYASRTAVDPVTPPNPDSFDPALVRRGAELAALGNCNVCHTAPNGQDFAGGAGIATPFGIIDASNITPDVETGIGAWSSAAFTRAMRDGVDRAGRHLYPAFPYDHFTHVTAADDQAIYAYLMTRAPVHAPPPATKLPFPFNIRLVMAGWNWLFLRPGPLKPDPAEPAAFNRGAYLAEGLGHCGACHTPHNALGAEQRSAHYAGAPVDGWYAPALDATAPAPIPWTLDTLAFYLKHGWAEHHGTANGPMAAVTTNLSHLPDDDIAAIATYVTARMGAPTAARDQHADALLEGQGLATNVSGPGAAIYAAACATCHESGRRLPFGGMHLGFSSAINAPSPRNVINIVLNGIPASAGEAAPIMPGFKGTLSQTELDGLLTYLRAKFSDQPKW